MTNPAIKLAEFIQKQDFSATETLTALSMVYFTTCYGMGMDREDMKKITTEVIESFFDSLESGSRGTLQ